MAASSSAPLLRRGEDRWCGHPVACSASVARPFTGGSNRRHLHCGQLLPQHTLNEIETVGCSEVMLSPDLFSHVLSFYPGQCMHLLKIARTCKLWRDEVLRCVKRWEALGLERSFGEADGNRGLFGEVGTFWNPSCVLPLMGGAVLAIADTQNHRVQLCADQGQPLLSSPCSFDADLLPQPGLLSFPAALANDDGSLYVVDATGRLLQLELPSLLLVDVVGGRGFREGQMGGAGGIVLAAGRIFVADNTNRRIAVWDTAPLRWRGVLGGACDDGPGRTRFLGDVYPVDVAVHEASSRLFVADAEGHRILVRVPTILPLQIAPAPHPLAWSLPPRP
jgi:hypothetical protein